MRQTGSTIKIVMVAAAVAALVAGAATLVLGSRHNGKKAKNTKRAHAAPATFTYDLGDFTVNLSEPNRYIKASLSVELEADGSGPSDGSAGVDSKPAHDEKEAKAQGGPRPPAAVGQELERKMPQLRDLIIEQLSAASFREMLTPQGRRDLKASVTGGLNESLNSCKVTRVYFTNFTMQ